MNGPGLLEYNAASHGIWMVAGLAFAVLGVFWLLDLVEVARGWFARRVLRRVAASPEEEAVPPPRMPSLHRDRSPRGGALTRYTSENRAIPIEPVRRPRIGSRS